MTTDEAIRFARFSFETALDQADDYSSVEESIAVHSENIGDTVIENGGGRAQLRAAWSAYADAEHAWREGQK